MRQSPTPDTVALVGLDSVSKAVLDDWAGLAQRLSSLSCHRAQLWVRNVLGIHNLRIRLAWDTTACVNHFQQREVFGVNNLFQKVLP